MRGSGPEAGQEYAHPDVEQTSRGSSKFVEMGLMGARARVYHARNRLFVLRTLSMLP